jgi:hypothetical protein
MRPAGERLPQPPARDSTRPRDVREPAVCHATCPRAVTATARARLDPAAGRSRTGGLPCDLPASGYRNRPRATRIANGRLPQPPAPGSPRSPPVPATARARVDPLSAGSPNRLRPGRPALRRFRQPPAPGSTPPITRVGSAGRALNAAAAVLPLATPACHPGRPARGYSRGARAPRRPGGSSCTCRSRSRRPRAAPCRG